MARSCYSKVLCPRMCAHTKRCCIKQHWFRAVLIIPSLIIPTLWLWAASVVNATLIIVTVFMRRLGQTIALNHRSSVTCKLPTECGWNVPLCSQLNINKSVFHNRFANWCAQFYSKDVLLVSVLLVSSIITGCSVTCTEQNHRSAGLYLEPTCNLLRGRRRNDCVCISLCS